MVTHITTSPVATPICRAGARGIAKLDTGDHVLVRCDGTNGDL